MMICFLKLLCALMFAYWCQKAIPTFSQQINRQIYAEYHEMISHLEKITFSTFEQHSILKSKNTLLSKGFFILFPIIILTNDSIILSAVLMILIFLALLDYCYYLTDIRYIALLFLLTFYQGNQETFYFVVVFFLIIHLFSAFVLKKDGFGLGDSLLLIAISPLFQLNEMLFLILFAALSGLFYALIYYLVKKQKLLKLPFIPFITLSTFCVIFARI